MPAQQATQLFLITPPLIEADPHIALLKELAENVALASVLVHVEARDDGTAKKVVRECAAAVQPSGAALLVGGWDSIVARAGADGVHVADGQKGLREALETFKPERIVGAGNVRSRHAAMQIAEAGADYVMFGEPSADGRVPPLDSVLERTRWWADLFEVPCVAYAPDLGSVPVLADSGADFVALGPAVFGHAQGALAALKLADAFLKQRSEP